MRRAVSSRLRAGMVIGENRVPATPVWLLQDALSWIEGLGAWGRVLFVALYVAATVLLIPGAALGLGAGARFGVVRGSVLVSLASTLGATCAFLLGRYLARDWVARRTEGIASFAVLDRAVAAEG